MEGKKLVVSEGEPLGGIAEGLIEYKSLGCDDGIAFGADEGISVGTFGLSLELSDGCGES